MRKNRIAYGLTLAALLILLFFFSEPYLGCAVGILVFLGIWSFVLIRRDAKGLELELHVRSGGQVGKVVPCELRINRKYRMLALRGLVFELEIHNALFEKDRKQTFYVELSGREETIPIPYEAVQCGEITFRCAMVKAVDFMGLYAPHLKPFAEKRMMIYPYTMQMEVSLSKMKTGSTMNDGAMQNRKGTDPSEMFDVREYVPGDDIRAIHWKLSGKLDTVMLRQASEPVHYQVALLPDMGKKNGDHEVTAAEINACIAAGAAVSQALLRQGVAFGVVLPSRSGLYVKEVSCRKDISQMLSEWLSMPLQEESGVGLQYFLHEHMEQYFTSVLILSAGTYGALSAGIDSHIGVTVLNTVEDIEHEMTHRSGNSDVVDIPARKTEETYFISC